MKTETKKPGELKFILIDFENEIIESVAAELKRIGRLIAMNEFSFIPFHTEVQDYIDSIFLQDDQPALKTSFEDVKEKELAGFISDNEIDHWDMIALLELLQQIESTPSES